MEVLAYLTNNSLRYDCYLLDWSWYIKKEFSMKETPVVKWNLTNIKYSLLFLVKPFIDANASP